MSSWACPRCDAPGDGDAPTEAAPRRCESCGAVVWGEDIYGFENSGSRRVQIWSQRSAPVATHLSVEVTDRGDVVLEGHDSGPLVDSIWGDTDYEYWVTVESSRVTELTRRLRDELEGTPNRSGPTRQESGGSAGIEAALLLKRAFREGKFSSSSEYRAWLDEKQIPAQFDSYT